MERSFKILKVSELTRIKERLKIRGAPKKRTEGKMSAKYSNALSIDVIPRSSDTKHAALIIAVLTGLPLQCNMTEFFGISNCWR